MNLFIDSNIWLSMYHFSNDDLREFGKLKQHLGRGIKLYFTQQVWDEFLRNREIKLQDTLKKFQLEKMQYPVFSKECPEYEAFNQSYKQVYNNFLAWKKSIMEQIEQRSLPADVIIREIVDLSERIDSNSFVEQAQLRYRKGNPPGKNDSYGDAINWECLLDKIPEGEDLYFISADKDYRSVLFDEKLHPFLAIEWEKKKRSKIHFYTSLTAFFRENISDIQLSMETEKQKLIDQLSDSTCFVTTHGVVAMMNRFSGWNEAQIEEICSAAESNFQVNWILLDDDIQGFFCKLLSDVEYTKLSDCATKRIIDQYIREGYLSNHQPATTTCSEDDDSFMY